MGLLTGSDTTILSSSEIQDHVDQLREISMSAIGTPTWSHQHQVLSKLNMQAHLDAQNQGSEKVIESIISSNKTSTLLHHLLTVDTWKSHVYPLLAKDLASLDTVKTYFILYHEAVVVNILELLLYHESAVLQLDEHVLDLVDFCHRKLTLLNAWEDVEQDPIGSTDLNQLALDSTTNLSHSKNELDFSIAMNALSILRYITDVITKVPLGVSTKILNDYDVPCGLVCLIEKAPWLKTRVKNKQKVFEKYEQGRWATVSKEDVLLMGKVEAQVWLCLYNLLVEPECQKKYQYSPHNHGIILRLPVLENLYRYLEQLSMIDPPVSSFGSNKVLVEEVSPMMNKILEKSNWNAMAKEQFKLFQQESKHDKEDFTQRLASLYDLSQLESFLEDPKCAKCGQLATQRCSRCKMEWYCSRPCQVKGWSNHKQICNMLVDAASSVNSNTKISLKS